MGLPWLLDELSYDVSCRRRDCKYKQRYFLKDEYSREAVVEKSKETPSCARGRQVWIRRRWTKRRMEARRRCRRREGRQERTGAWQRRAAVEAGAVCFGRVRLVTKKEVGRAKER